MRPTQRPASLTRALTWQASRRIVGSLGVGGLPTEHDQRVFEHMEAADHLAGPQRPRRPPNRACATVAGRTTGHLFRFAPRQAGNASLRGRASCRARCRAGQRPRPLAAGKPQEARLDGLRAQASDRPLRDGQKRKIVQCEASFGLTFKMLAVNGESSSPRSQSQGKPSCLAITRNCIS